MDSPESGDSNPPVLVSNLRSRKQNMTKTAQHSKRSKDLTGDGAFAGCVRQTFPSPATWWVFNHHNRNLHEWSGIRSTRMYPSDPTQKQVLVVRPRGGRSGKNWRIFVRPREVVVKIIISPKATGRRWNGVFHPRPDGKGASRREVWFGNNRLPSVYTKPNSFVFKSTSWQELHFSLATPPIICMNIPPCSLIHLMPIIEQGIGWYFSLSELRLFHQESDIWILHWYYWLIGRIQYSWHIWGSFCTLRYIHHWSDIWFCSEIYLLNIFDSQYTLWFSRFCRDLFGFGRLQRFVWTLGEVCGFDVG